MIYVYIIHSETLNKFYIGRTGNIDLRIEEHNSGKSKFTKTGVPWVLVYYSAFIEKLDAVSEEKFLKSGVGRERRKYLLAEYMRKQML